MSPAAAVRLWLAWGVGIVALAGKLLAGEPEAAGRTESAHLLFQQTLVELDIRVSPEGWAALLQQTMDSPKLYAEATVRSGGRMWRNVGLKLKGSYGSFQGAGERPGLTLHFDKFKGSERFHGLARIHLNNAAQDESYLQEWLGAELARAAGVPAGRCTHARVTLQGQPRGLYVLRESFTRDFLAGWFGGSGKGDLYDAGPGGDLGLEMEKDQGDPGDHAALQALLEAAGEENPAERVRRLEQHLDLDRFHRFAAAEILLGHWDGYTLAANNYRLYRNPANGRFAFLLHGMDQILGDPDAPVYPPPTGLLARSILGSPGAWDRLAGEMRRQRDQVWSADNWPGRIRDRSGRLAQALEATEPELSRRLREMGEDLAQRFAERRRRIAPALEHPPRPVEWDSRGRVVLAEGWHADAGEGSWRSWREGTVLGMEAAGESVGSWRQTLLLPPGRYRFSARIGTRDVVGTGDRSGRGAGIGILGSDRPGPRRVRGTHPGSHRRIHFEADGPVTLLLELRAGSGTATFPLGDLQLEKR